MNNTDFIKKFINEFQIENNRYSCLVMALNDARKITGRNIENGKYEFNILESKETFLNPHSFIGIINYLLILDMIGEIFTTRTFTSNKSNIYKALKIFSITPEKDINVIISLRNSLAHNYGLINIPKDRKEDPYKLHKFIIVNDSIIQLIEYPKIQWNGDYNDKDDDSSTKVGYIQLCDLIETVYTNLKSMSAQNSITLNLNDGIEELKSRFTIRH